MDMDDAGLDADLDNILQRIKEGQQNMSDQPGKVGHETSDFGAQSCSLTKLRLWLTLFSSHAPACVELTHFVFTLFKRLAC